jgi:starch synthase (maltosyl-transferring)
MGFDVLYLPPVHPIGRTGRKGKDNAASCAPADPGCPWAIGSAEGGHKSIHSQLGSLTDFRRLVKKAEAQGLEIAMDLAFQCSPDHPYVRTHPEWFRRRPDGSIQCAENAPKVYEDIIPLNFETPQWRALWEELKNIVLFWIKQGVRIFRVDNPHTKPFAFWEWLIAELRRNHPDVILLAEAFTRRKVMQRLAKVGFNQSYTYFTWRHTKQELEQYIQELAHTELSEYLRPNFWPNTPDILPPYLQDGGRAAFVIRLVLAATLCPSYGIYGPAFELCVDKAVPGTEEYLDSEKYKIKRWNWNQKGNLCSVIARVNRARRRNTSLQGLRNIQIHSIDNENMLCYSKATEDKSDITVAVVSLDPHRGQTGTVKLPIRAWGIEACEPYRVDDALTGATHLWRGATHRVKVDPRVMPAQILSLRRSRSSGEKRLAHQVKS